MLLLHELSIIRHGGIRGLRDEGLLDSALARPLNILHYEVDVSLQRLAAAYAVRIARNLLTSPRRLLLRPLGDPIDEGVTVRHVSVAKVQERLRALGMPLHSDEVKGTL